jgi:MoxR-like ATPase
MLEKILKLYTMYMACDVRSPLPHLFGPPGCGKSTVAEQAAELIGVNLHIINVSRISPLELEGVQMPHGTKEQMKLKLLHATFWTQLKEGDILLLDEFLRGFPEVYNGLLDILTARRVGSFVLPKVFILGASNSTVAYDKALEDRLLHLPAPDPRVDKKVKAALAKLIVDKLGLLPQTATSMEMQNLLDTEVLPMYEVLDNLRGNSSSAPVTKGHSVRNLIGQAELREVQSPALKELINMNNLNALRQGKPQFVFLCEARDTLALTNYAEKAEALVGNDKLSPIQVRNLDLNLQLIEMEKIRNEKGTVPDEPLDTDVDDLFN